MVAVSDEAAAKTVRQTCREFENGIDRVHRRTAACIDRWIIKQAFV